MTPSWDEAITRLNAILEMPHGAARFETSEQTLRQIESEGPARALPFAFHGLILSSYFGGRIDRSFVVFARALKLWDERPELFDDDDRHNLFESFAWMVETLPSFPEIGSNTIERNLRHMDERFRQAGRGTSLVSRTRFRWARDCGAGDADALFEAWRHMPRDEHSGCESGENHTIASWLIKTGRVEEGIRIAEAVLAKGKVCPLQPDTVLAELAEAYLAVGREVDAAAAFRRADSALAHQDRPLAEARGTLVRVLARTGNIDRCLQMIAGQHRLLTEAMTPNDRFLALVSVGAATRVMRGEHADRPVKVPRVPVTTVAQLDDWARAEAEVLGAAFDARNGTDLYRQRIDEAWSTRPHPTPVDLSVSLTAPSPGSQDPGTVRSTRPSLISSVLSTRRTGAAERALARAEELADAGDLESATGHYVAAADAFDDRGLLADAGFAWAEAAHATAELGDDEGACRGYAAAVDRLLASGTNGSSIVPVLVAWARPAAAVDRTATALNYVTKVDSALGSDERDAPARTDLADTRARLLAADGRLTEAALLARRTAEAYAAQGRTQDAAHAFWLAGEAHQLLGQNDEAIWALEVAAEGFALSRDDRSRLRVSNDLAALIRQEPQT